MSYSRQKQKRTISCSYCRCEGHNKSSCPQYAAAIERRRERDPHDWAVSSYDNRKAQKKVNSQNRKCSYCDQGGHNRATCQPLKSNIELTLTKNSVFRKNIYERMQVIGLGLGTIVEHPCVRQRDDINNSKFYNTPQVITSIAWEDLNFWGRRNILYAKPLTNITRSWTEQLPLPRDEVIDKIYSARQYGSRDWATIITGPSVPQTPPKGWFDSDIKSVKSAYKERTMYQGEL